MVITLYESGTRASEFLTLQIKDVEFDEFGAKVRLVGKTGERFVRLIMSVPYLLNWISNHPMKHDKNAWLWVNENKARMNLSQPKPIGYTPLTKIIKSIMKKAGVNRKDNLHSFRKSRACYTANLKIHGLHNTKDDQHNKILQPIRCDICMYFNNAKARFCARCGKPLTLQTIIEEEQKIEFANKVMQKGFEKEEFKTMIKEIVKEILVEERGFKLQTPL